MLDVGLAEPDDKAGRAQGGEVLLEESVPELPSLCLLELRLAELLVALAIVVYLLDEGVVGIGGFFHEEAEAAVVLGDAGQADLGLEVLVLQVALQLVEEGLRTSLAKAAVVLVVTLGRGGTTYEDLAELQVLAVDAGEYLLAVDVQEGVVAANLALVDLEDDVERVGIELLVIHLGKFLDIFLGDDDEGVFVIVDVLGLVRQRCAP